MNANCTGDAVGYVDSMQVLKQVLYDAHLTILRAGQELRVRYVVHVEQHYPWPSGTVKKSPILVELVYITRAHCACVYF